MERGLLLQFVATLLFFFSFAIVSRGDGIGVNYGTLGDNLPFPQDAVDICSSHNITRLRLTSKNFAAITALRNTGISVVLSPSEVEIPLLRSPATAVVWVKSYVVPNADAVDIRYISIGDQEVPRNNATSILHAMLSVARALKLAGLSIPVTTAVSMTLLQKSYLPSQSTFSPEALTEFGPIFSYLASTGAPLLVNVYPYYAYAANPEKIRLDYVLFTTAGGVVVKDGALGYWNMFDAMVDAMRTALERGGWVGLEVVVSATGWPSAGNRIGAAVDNARIYNNNLIAHIDSRVGTPKLPGKEVEVYISSLFDENIRPEGPARHFGMFNVDLTEVYHVDF